MVVLMIAALVCGFMSFVMLWPYGALAALLGAPLGASLLALTAGLLLALLRVKAGRKQSAAFQFPSWIDKPEVAGTSEQIAKALPSEVWQRLSAGDGTKGLRL
jgi:hypothetical protein